MEEYYIQIYTEVYEGNHPCYIVNHYLNSGGYENYGSTEPDLINGLIKLIEKEEIDKTRKIFLKNTRPNDLFQFGMPFGKFVDKPTAKRIFDQVITALPEYNLELCLVDSWNMFG